MYTREQVSQFRQAFWTTFGQYIASHLSAEGLKTNWLNYRTGVKHVNFRMQADKNSASIAIELTHPDIELQELFFEQFQELKNVLHSCLGEEWEWLLHATDDEGRTISKIYKEIASVNIFNRDDWPTLIYFFKPRIISLDEFWSDARYTFEAL